METTRTKNVARQSLGDLDLSVNKELINNIKLHSTLWYTEKYTQNDEELWNGISAEMGIQKSWLKRRWHTLRTNHNDYARNSALAKQLSFLKKSAKGAKNADGKIKDDKQIEEGDEFHVTQEQLDETDSNDLNAMHFDADDESTESFEEYELTVVDDGDEDEAVSNDSDTKAVTLKNIVEDVDDDTSEQSPVPASATAQTDKFSVAPKELEYQDVVFGELVSAMLARMTPEKKKQSKKEIMNILL